MHVLIIPPGHYATKKAPLGAIFQRHQAQALKHGIEKIGIISAGFVPFKMTFSSYPYPAYEKDDSINIYRCYKKMFVPGRIALRLFWPYLINLYIKMFDNYVRVHGLPDIIHAHNCLYAGVAALKLKNKYHVPYLITEHSSAYARGLISKQEARLTKNVLINANAITVVSSSIGNTLENMYGPVIHVDQAIFNILDGRFEKESRFPTDVQSDPGVFTFLSIGGLDANKNHIDLLKAFALKFRGNRKAKLRIGGDGPLRRYLEKQAQELGLYEQVDFLGTLNRDDVIREIHNCDVFVLPSIIETFGVVLIEAMALGKPAISTKCGGPEDIVNENNGILVPAKDISALASALEYIHINISKYDANLIRNNCLSRFGKQPFIKRLTNIYAHIQNEEKMKSQSR